MVVDPRLSRFALPSDAPFNPVQRAWLEGFLAGFGAPGGTPTAAEAPAATLTVVFASQTGTAEGLAKKLAKAAVAKGIKAKAMDVEKLKPGDLLALSPAVFVASTHGEGDPPDAAKAFAEGLGAANGAPLAGLQFAVLALGDSNYARFCGFGRLLDERLAALGGARLVDRIDCDLDVDEPFGRFRDTLLTRLQDAARAAPSLGAAVAASPAEDDEAEEIWSRKRPFPAALIEARRLNRQGSDKETTHVALSLADSGLTYEPGDALGVLPSADPAAVDAVLAAAGFSGEEGVGESEGVSLRVALTHNRAIGKLAHATLIKFQAKAESADLARLLEPDNVGEREAYLHGRELIDLLAEFPGVGFSPEELIAMLPRLAPRLYSISSSLRAHAGEVHLTVGVVRYEAWGRRRGGIASTQIADRLPVGATLPVYVHRNPRFRLPEDGDRPIIMIGPGTGIAPFRAFLEERRALGVTGKNWLFFGDRRARYDYLYRDELQTGRFDGVLSRLDTAFSRDQTEKIYVQNLMRDAGAELWRWLRDGAHLYVCGDAERMAKDVDEALLAIIAEHGRMSPAKAKLELQQLTSDRRYCRDVY